MRAALLCALVGCSSAAPRASEPVPPPSGWGTIKSTVLASVAERPTSLTLDADHVYWTTSTEAWRVAKSGGTPERIWADLPGATSSIVVGNELWVTTTSDVRALRIGTDVQLPISKVLGQLVRGPDGIYIASPHRLVRETPNAEEPVSAEEIVAITGGDPVIYATRRTIRGTPTTEVWRVEGSNSAFVTDLGSATLLALAHDGSSVMIVLRTPKGIELDFADLHGSRHLQFATDANDCVPPVIVVHDGAWWIGASGIVRMSLREAQSVVLVDTPATADTVKREALAADDDSFYWLSTEQRGSTTTFAVKRAKR